MRRTMLMVFLLPFAIAPWAVGGEEAAPPAPPEVEDITPLSQLNIIYKRSDIQGECIDLSLPDAIRLTLEHNNDIRIQRLGVPISEQGVGEQRAAFDPVIESGVSARKSVTQNASLLEGALTPVQQQTGGSVALKEKLPTGANYSLSFNDSRQWSNSSNARLNPEYDTALRLDITQPLLRDFGLETNRAGINKAENAVKMAAETCREQIIAAIAAAMNSYWELVFNIMDLQVREVSLKQAQQLLDDNRVKFGAGTAPRTDLLAAEAGVASRQADLHRAKAAVENVEDQIKLLINVDSARGEAAWALPVSPQTAPKVEDFNADIPESLEAARTCRPDYQRFLYELKNRNIELKYRRNQLWPSLDLNLAGELAGLGKDNTTALDNTRSTDYYAAEGGILLRLPLGNRAQESAFYRAKLELAQTDLRLERLKQTIVIEVRNAIRRMKTARAEIDATEVLRNAEWKRLEAERQRFDAGRSTSSDVLTFQEQFAVAQRRYIRSLIDYNQALVDLHRCQGTLLDYVNVQITY